MRKVLSSLVILAILVGMFVCMGTQAFAEEGPKDLAIVAVANDGLSADHINRIKESMPDKEVLVIDVNGLDFEQAGEDYNYVYVDMDQGFEPSGYAFIRPGMDSVPTMEVTDNGENHCKVVLLPIGPDDTVETINAVVEGYKAEGETAVVVAIAPESCYNVQTAVDSNVDKVLTCGETDAAGDKLIKVGGDGANPVSVVTVDEFGSVTAENMPLPEATDPGVGTVEEDPGIADMLAPGLPVAPTEETEDSGEPEPAPETTEPEAPEAETYKVYYDGNGNDVGTWMPDPEVEAGAYTLADNEYTKAGYEFAGWQIQGEDTVYGENDTINVESDITVVAQWTETAGVGGITFTIVTYESGVEGLEDVQGAAGTDGKITLSECPDEWTYEGHAFEGWKLKDGEDVTGDLLTAGSEYEGEAENGITFVAQWKEVEPTDEPEPTEPSAPTGDPMAPVAPGLTEVVVTYKYNEETVENKYMSGAKVNLSTFADCAFVNAAPEGQKFKAWKLGETEYAEGAEYTLGTEGVTFEAVFEAIPAESFTVTFDANGGTGSIAALTAAPNGVITLPAGSALTAPANKAFAGWKIGEQTYQANAQYTVTANVTAYAQWTDLQSAGHVDTLLWTNGGTDALTVTYSAPIATISMDGVQLTANTHYQLSNNNMTALFYTNYLNELTVGNHTVVFSFSASPTAAYADETVTLSISAAAEQPAKKALEYTWTDRNQPLTISLTDQPTELLIDYGSNGGLKSPQGNTNYSISGNSLTLQPDLVNKNNGGVWPAGRYGFEVKTANSADNTDLRITLTSNTVNNTSTTKNPGGTSPVTGDTNNVVLYVVLLAVLVVALAVVIVVMVKRRNSGRR